MLNIRAFVFGLLRENTYVLSSLPGQAVVIDPGCETSEELDFLLKWLEEHELKPEAVVLTHAHHDHRAGAGALQRTFGIPVYMHEAEKTVFDDLDFETSPLEDGQSLTLAGITFEVIATPGHTPGGVCLYDRADGALLSGDTLFRGTIGRTDLPGGDYDKLIVSVMDKVMGLDGDVEIFPGHGPASTIAEERTENPFLQPFNEPWENES